MFAEGLGMKTAVGLSVLVRRPALVMLVTLILGNSFGAQEAKPGTGASSAPPASVESGAPVLVLKAKTRLVTVDVVAKDKHGHLVSDMTARDFQIFEQVPPKKGELEQKIADFGLLDHAVVAASTKPNMPKMPDGVYTNLVTTRLSVPPTIVLMDGLNTDVDSGMQARRQMVKMLASIPADTPVAVFLLGNQLVLLQSFTKDPNLLRDAAQKVLSMDNAGRGIDAHDDPNSLSNQTNDMFGTDDEAPPSTVSSTPGRGGAVSMAPSGPPGGELQMAEIRRFEKETFSADTDMRVRTTLDALRAIARHVSGYPGRKNLLWISSSFPMTIAPDPTAAHNLTFEGSRSYQTMVASATNALADAKVAVYPVNPAGVQTQAMFAASKNSDQAAYGPRSYSEGKTLNRENEARFSAEESMAEVAEQTGGKICINNNDLTDCVKTAVEEGSSYYELAYYPDASNWHGEFHRIIVKTTRPGVQLSFRQGYFARATDSGTGEKDKTGTDPQLQQAACEDLLTSTSLLVVARALPPDKPGLAKYYLAIGSRMLTFSAGDGGSHELRMDVAVCSFDKAGKPLQYLQDNGDQKLGEKEYAAMISSHAVPHVIQFSAKEGIARVRLVVRDSATGQMGSIDVPYVPVASSTPAAANKTSPSGLTAN